MTAPDPAARSRRSWLRWALPLLAVLVVAAVVLVVTTRGGDGAAAGSAAASSSAAAPTTDPGAASGSAPATASAPLTQLPAPSVVARQGVPASARTVSAATAAFTAPASWSDGAAVRVTKAHQQVTSGQGPGVLVGQPQTVFSLALTNGSARPLALDAVVVQATYGSGHAQASPVYDASSQDFAGTLAPGATATATYSFTIPADQLGDVTLSVDVDGQHFPAVFSGAVPTS